MKVQRALFLGSLAAVCWAMPSSLAKHPTLSGADLLNRCNANEYACEAYISGVVDEWCAKEGWPHCAGRKGKDSADTICLPDEVSSRQLKDVVVHWLQKSDTIQISIAPPLILSALSDTYPCPKIDW
jgi:hypothetical protein